MYRSVQEKCSPCCLAQSLQAPVQRVLSAPPGRAGSAPHHGVGPAGGRSAGRPHSSPETGPALVSAAAAGPESAPAIVTRLLAFLIRGYRYWLSPWLGNQCRFYPSCSQYALDAPAEHGAARGSWLTLRRLSRCHPWHEGGHDPVPPASTPPHPPAGTD